MNDGLRDVHRDAIFSVFAANDRVERAMLFGSRAMGTNTVSSDVDIALFGNRLTLTDQARIAAELDKIPMAQSVDLVLYDSIRNTALDDQIKKHGVEWYQRNNELVGDRETIPRIFTRGKSGRRSNSSGQNWGAFGECGILVRDTVLPSNCESLPYIGLEHIEKETLSLLGHGKVGDVISAKFRFQQGDILFGKLRPYFRKVVRAPFDGVCSTDIWVVRSSDSVDRKFLYYLMASKKFVDAAAQGSDGTRMPRAKWDHVSQFRILLPTLARQRSIAHILGTLDDKIELNRRMNATLETMARALFKSWFVDFDPVRAKMEGRDTGLPKHIADLFPGRLVKSELGMMPKGWRIKPLDAIAWFQNGLALQKHRPRNGQARLPVVKIAQLRTGRADSKEWASADIKPECILNNGDIVFSWSGSLLVRFWCGGPAALNQHLFKVTSNKFPKWFYWHCVLIHLENFQRIAQGKATTMGHIRRHHLGEALCAVPPDSVINSITHIFDTLLKNQIANEIESHTLVTLRDILLPKLISGKIRIT